MKIVSEKTTYYKYAFEYDFSMELLEFCRWLKGKVTWKEFSFNEKKWRFNSIAVADIIKAKYPDVEIDEAVSMDWKKYLLRKAEEQLIEEKANQLKKKTTSDLVIKGLKGTMYDFQKVGTEFLINNNGRAILNSDMGTGKSLQALAYIVHEKIDKILIITPSSVKWSFCSEVLKWTSLKPIIIESKTNFTIDVFKENDVFIINYDLLKKFFTQLISYHFGCLIVDECQKIKSLQALRSKLTKQIARKINKIILLTGTLMLSRPCELFNPLNILDPFVWNNWKYFTKKYCNGHDTSWGYDFSGASNIEELKQNINKYYIRHTKEEALKDLPEKVFVDVPIELNSESRFSYDLILSSFVEYLKDIKGKNRNEINKSLQAEKLVKLNELRQIATNGKINDAIELIENIIDNDQKVIVFSNYNEPLKKIQENFKDNSVLLIGETPEFIRRGIIDAFQNKKEINVFLCGFSSGGVGITLTAANNIIFLDFPWNPADISQAYSRAHRIGNKANHINIYQIIAKDTIDTKIKNIIEEKKILIDKIFDNNNKNIDNIKQINIIEDLIKEIQVVKSI